MATACQLHRKMRLGAMARCVIPHTLVNDFTGYVEETEIGMRVGNIGDCKCST
jgi:hypothetical protein